VFSFPVLYDNGTTGNYVSYQLKRIESFYYVKKICIFTKWNCCTLTFLVEILKVNSSIIQKSYRSAQFSCLIHCSLNDATTISCNIY
jgi:hypothetical protein